MRKLAIAVCYFYPEKEYFQNEACIPLQVGFEETNIEMGIQKDNEGDNIGNKHPYYSELSGLYWLWKNVNADYKGLFHHRRALTLRKEPLKYRLRSLRKKLKYMVAIFFKPKEYYSLHNVTIPEEEYKSEVNKFLAVAEEKYIDKYDILAPVPATIWPFSVQRFFHLTIETRLFTLMTNIISDKFPEYIYYWNKTLNSRKIYYANISIMRNQLFDKYANFIFCVLNNLEEKLIHENYYKSLTEEVAIARKFGYLGELLTNAFILSQIDKGAKIKELNITIRDNARVWNMSNNK